MLPPTDETHFTMSGDVTIHPGAAIAPGVVLQADPGSRIVIGAGVCIGMGSLLHAYQGSLEIAQGSTLGFRVLIVGAGHIGANACIGPGVTIIANSVPDGAVIPAGTIIGDAGRSQVINAPPDPAPPATPATEAAKPFSASPSPIPSTPASTDSDSSSTPPDDPTALPEPTPIVSNTFSYTAYSETNIYAARYATFSNNEPDASFTEAEAEAEAESPEIGNNSTTSPTPAPEETGDSSQLSNPMTNPPVYGQASLDRLMGMLFPYRQALDDDSSNDTPSDRPPDHTEP